MAGTKGLNILPDVKPKICMPILDGQAITGVDSTHEPIYISSEKGWIRQNSPTFVLLDDDKIVAIPGTRGVAELVYPIVPISLDIPGFQYEPIDQRGKK